MYTWYVSDILVVHNKKKKREEREYENNSLLKGYIFTNYCPVGKKKEMKKLGLERK